MGIIKSKKAKPILVCGDHHAPYVHRWSIQFLKQVREDYECQEVIIMDGDFFDFHAMSRFTTEPDSPSPDAEYEAALEYASRFTKEFPEGVLVLGNHDLIPQRQLKELHLSEKILKSPNDLYGLPKGWKIERLAHVLMDGKVLVEHGIGSEGVNGALNTAVFKRSSFIQGHCHAEAGCRYSANHDSLIFGLNTGCLCDNTALAMRYAAYAKKKGVLGCGVVYSPSHAIFVPMRFSERRDGRDTANA